MELTDTLSDGLGIYGSAGGTKSGLGIYGSTGGGKAIPTVQGPPVVVHHGLLHSVFHNPVTHVVGKTVHDLEQAAIHTPAGLYEVGKAGVHAAEGHPDELLNVGKGIVTGTIQDLEHPLRHPGYTLLDLAGVVSGGVGVAARAGRIAKALEAGDAAGAAKALAFKAPAEARTISHGNLSVPAGTYSQNEAFRLAQKLTDKVRQTFPEARIGLRTQPERVGMALKENRRISEAVSRVPAGALAAIKLNRGEQAALRVVAEGIPVGDRIRFHQDQLPHLPSARLQRQTVKTIAALKAAEAHIHDVHGVPRFKPSEKRLIDIYEQAKTVATKRETMLKDAGLLTDYASEGRVSGPGNVILHGEAHPDFGGQMPLFGETGQAFIPELVPEVFKGGDFRVPYQARKAPRALGGFTGMGKQGVIGIPRKPGTLTHSFEGEILKAGGGRSDTSKLVAEGYLEAHRFTALLRARHQFVEAAHDSYEGPNDIAINLGVLSGNKIPAAVRDILQRAEVSGHLTDTEVQALGPAYDGLKEELFPKDVHPDEQIPGIKWIDKRYLGGLNEDNPLAGVRTGTPTGKFLSVADAINNASKIAILYLKPAYLLPNLIGNAALTLVQQGFAAPFNLAKAARWSVKLTPDIATGVDAAMGDGLTAVLSSEQGIGSKAAQLLAGKYGKIVDTPFRRAAFYHEASKAGYKSAEQIRHLLSDPNGEDLARISQRANAALIDYGRLGPTERAFVRRIIFFYPWVKGSTRYAARFATENPVQAAVGGQLAKTAAQKQQTDLGNVPSFAQGLFKVGQRGANPLVVNPQSAAILDTPAELAQAVEGILNGNPAEATSFTQNLTPAAAAVLALLTNRDSLGRTAKPGVSPLHTAASTLYGGLPALSLEQRLTHDQSGRLYPVNVRDALMQFFVGTASPKPVNKQKLNATAWAQAHPRG
jgi:hypothetical protein